MPLQMKLTAITLDCADPEALAAFYEQATSFAPHPESDQRSAMRSGLPHRGPADGPPPAGRSHVPGTVRYRRRFWLAAA